MLFPMLLHNEKLHIFLKLFVENFCISEILVLGIQWSTKQTNIFALTEQWVGAEQEIHKQIKYAVNQEFYKNK